MNITASYLDLVSGARRGVAASVARALLACAAAPYRASVALRNAWYNHVRAARSAAGVPVISIGNITTGGSGKTPMTALVAARLIAAGRRVGILMRGYKAARHASAGMRGPAVSDEALMLPRLCPQARVYVNADRVAGARQAISQGCTALVMDDGFQHRRLQRDLDVVLVDATCPFGHGHLLPRGLLREPLTAMRRAGLVIVTRADALDSTEGDELVRELARRAPGTPVLRARHAVTLWTDLSGRRLPSVDPSAMRVLAFAGIANFGAFADTLERMGVQLLAGYEFPDHHDYTDSELQELSDTAASLEANAVVTTEKDAVKLIDRWPAESTTSIIAPRVEIQLNDADQRVLDDALSRVLNGAAVTTAAESMPI